jgi:purine nucleoside permease
MSFFHPMRTLSFVIVTAFAVGFVASAAHAYKIRPLANHGPADVAQACSSSGGSYWSNAITGDYGCSTENCDGKGGTCTVDCNKNHQCYGSTPIVAGGTLNPNLTDILKGGPKFQTQRPVRSLKAR